jgi:hypothetical protein
MTDDPMTEHHAAFVGTVPSNYDRYLGPILFHGYADDLVARVPVSRGMRVLARVYRVSEASFSASLMP